MPPEPNVTLPERAREEAPRRVAAMRRWLALQDVTGSPT